jgi:hypothetical protein
MYNPSPAKLKQLIVLLSSFLACLFFGVLGYDVFKDGIPLLDNASRIISSVSSHKHRSPKLDPPAKVSDIAILMKSSFNSSATCQLPRHTLLATLFLQKTGSTQLEKLLTDAIRRRGWLDEEGQMRPAHASRCTLSMMGSKTRPLGWSACTHHADAAHLASCAALSLKRRNQAMFDEMFLLTMLREPAQRLYSEFHHLGGQVSCHGSAWKHYAPGHCNGSVLLPTQRWIGEPMPPVSSPRATFEEWLAVNANCAHNRMVRQLAPLACDGSLASSPAYPGNEKQMLELAIETLRKRTLFGLTERYDESIQLINVQLGTLFRNGHPLGTLSLQRPDSTNASLSTYPISAAAQALISARSAEDIALYKYATTLFDRLHVTLLDARAATRRKSISRAASLVASRRKEVAQENTTPSGTAVR